MKLYELTKYPFLFKDTYWGNFDDTKAHWEKNELETILENRRKFVEEFHITKQDNTKSGGMPFREEGVGGCQLEGVDHPETYRNKAGEIFCIISIYSKALPLAKELSKRGFKSYLPLYSLGAKTFLARFETLQHARNLITPKETI